MPRENIKNDRSKNPRKLTIKDMAKILDLKVKGALETDIAMVVNKHVVTVSECVRHFEPILKYVSDAESYRAEKSNLLDAAEMLALKSLCTSLQRDEGNMQQRAVAFRELFHANRLTKGESTSNKAVIQFSIPDELAAAIGGKKPILE